MRGSEGFVLIVNRAFRAKLFGDCDKFVFDLRPEIFVDDKRDFVNLLVDYPRDVFHEPVDDRFPRNRDKRFWNSQRMRTQSRAATGHWNDYFHKLKVESQKSKANRSTNPFINC